MQLTHLDEEGHARMVDVGGKPDTERVAVATGEITMRPETLALIQEGGISKGDAHADDWHRQVSLLALESIGKMRALGLNVGPGSFAENLTTQGLGFLSLPIGSQVRVGDEVILEITKHGKVCHDRCAIYHQVGDCVMPREGIFARVIKGSQVKEGDTIEILEAIEQP